ncbi:hypothetical protein PF005_g2215 [Phytophthora fragariae]|uniref:Uncharacterized protein n=2 Tax=Phytophthora TaxID=4783 RepID=A0A6A4AB74_9STRA|nr:hypothetical protein PF003_g20087 [Phytophthora fragariae]KAE9045446.1 hypothetical protein PR002_g2230 [Phytophthora rubi]KAE8947905.1 hypothetical protein PF009_g2517 [Phytophthora fragariae]KAE9028314.1 hypothetical protein PF011_g1642 [Phytophthora fragariae]KAE9051238.1 hypothetical protein PR001_g1644 [Phytophthora rubi]
MATTSTPTASIAIPSDVHPFAANVSPRGVDLEGRLDLSLDALIKERKKEHKLLKKEEASKQKQKPQPADKRKTPKQQKPQQQQKQQKTVKNGQAVQRKALVNKNRGLPATSAAVKDKTSQNKTKTSIAATTAKLRRQMRAEKADKNASGRLVTSPRTAKGTHQNNVVQQVKKNKNTPQQARKVTSPTRFVQPKGGKKQQPQTQAIAPVRQVMRSNNKKTKLSITIPGSAGKKNAQKKQKNANKVLLPGKLSQTLAKKNSAAKKVVKRAKNRKAVSGKATQVVRKGTGQRKKN